LLQGRLTLFKEWIGSHVITPSTHRTAPSTWQDVRARRRLPTVNSQLRCHDRYTALPRRRTTSNPGNHQRRRRGVSRRDTPGSLARAIHVIERTPKRDRRKHRLLGLRDRWRLGRHHGHPAGTRCRTDPSCLRLTRPSAPRYRLRIAHASPRPGHATHVDRHMGGRRMGNSLLSASRLRIGPAEQKTTLLQTYWTVPDRQIETSVVLADPPLR
jgi:hypothetical protein